MKKPLIALALSSLAMAASAQSTVTVFGVVDLGYRVVKNGDGGSTKSVFDGGLGASRLGFRGVEDLGGGLKAGFWLEAPVFADVGNAGTPTGAPAAGGATIAGKFFQRRSTVSLSGNWGELRLGRDFDPSFLNLGEFDVYGTTGFAGNANLVGGGSLAAVGLLGSAAGTIARVDNSVTYFLPSEIGGVYGSVQVAADEGVNTSNGNNHYSGARLGWSGGPFNAAGAVGRTRIPGNSNFKVWNIGASYTAPFATLMMFYHHADYTPAGLPQRSQKFWGVGARVPVGQGEIRTTYQRSDIGGGTPIGLRNQDDSRQYAVGYVYNLSKRTALYGDVGRIENRGLSALAFPGGSAVGSNFGVIADRNSTAMDIGIRHVF